MSYRLCRSTAMPRQAGNASAPAAWTGVTQADGSTEPPNVVAIVTTPPAQIQASCSRTTPADPRSRLTRPARQPRATTSSSMTTTPTPWLPGGPGEPAAGVGRGGPAATGLDLRGRG